MRIACISDTHNRTRDFAVPACDVLIHAGDFTEDGSDTQVLAFLDWFQAQPAARRILVAGNHDLLFHQRPEVSRCFLEAYPGVSYLQDQGLEFGGLRFWGTPWSPPAVRDMRDSDWAFRRQRGAHIDEVWSWIPHGLDVLVTHCPPGRILDQTWNGSHVGCKHLALRLPSLRPRLHVFGHVHHGHGQLDRDGTIFVNASTVAGAGSLRNPPILIDL